MLGRRIVMAGLLVVLVVAASASSAAFAQRPAPTPKVVALPSSPRPASPDAIDDPRAPKGWKRYEFQFAGGDVLGVVLPYLPEAHVESKTFSPEVTATTHLYVMKTSSDVFAVSYVDGLPVQLTGKATLREAFFRGVWNGFAESVRTVLEKKGVDAQLVTQPPRNRMYGAYEAQEQEFSIGKMPGTARAILSSGYAYMIVSISLTGEVGDEHKQFLESFALRPRR